MGKAVRSLTIVCEQAFQTSLGNFGLCEVYCIVPSRVLKQVTLELQANVIIITLSYMASLYFAAVCRSSFSDDTH